MWLREHPVCADVGREAGNGALRGEILVSKVGQSRQSGSHTWRIMPSVWPPEVVSSLDLVTWTGFCSWGISAVSVFTDRWVRMGGRREDGCGL